VRPGERAVPGGPRVEQIPVFEREAERRADRVGLSKHRNPARMTACEPVDEHLWGPRKLVPREHHVEEHRTACGARDVLAQREVLLELARRVGELDEALAAAPGGARERKQNALR